MIGSSRSRRFVIAGLVPAISIRRAQCPDYRDGRDKPGHDEVEAAASFARVTVGPRGHFSLTRAPAHRSG